MSLSTENLSSFRSGRRRTLSRDAIKSTLSIPLSRGNSSTSLVSSNLPTPDIDRMLEPAVDGPPSPERLRQLSKQMKRGSHFDRSGHRMMPSATSPRAAMDGRPQWETAFESMGLSRQPSSRSAESSNSSREFLERERGQSGSGKSFFQRTAMSSNSSLHSGETPAEENTLKESLIPISGLFARRKPSRDETTQKRLQISGPFNFHHVTHHQRDNLHTAQGSARSELSSEFSQMPTSGPSTAPGVLRGIEAQDIYLMNNSTDALNAEALLSPPPIRPQLVPRHTAPAAPRRMLRGAKSSDHLRSSPPRPQRPQMPNSIGSNDPAMGGPVPPPRASSRQSVVQDGFSAYAPAAASPLDRPRTSGGFRQPQPFSPDQSITENPFQSPPATSHSCAPSADSEPLNVQHEGELNVFAAQDETGWPLASPPASFDKVLPDVPEEEEHHYGASHRARLSLTSSASLRISQSVPMLRSFSQSQRRPSGASDTLGRLDIAAARRAINEEEDDEAVIDHVHLQENWEDCIDYCYEHEADANFEYQWERHSMDVAREATPQTSVIDLLDELDEMDDSESLPGLATTTPVDAVSQSPSSVSHDRASRDVLNPSSYPAVRNNFSLPRGEKGGRLPQLQSLRPDSTVSNFRESQGFHLSPSLLIPGDYHQQMLMTETERYEYHEDDEVFREAFQGPYGEGFDHGEIDQSLISRQQRSSTSTAETSFSSRSDTTGERHISANSAFTTLTRLTVSSSSTSLNKQADIVTDFPDPMPGTQIVDAQDEDVEVDEAEPAQVGTNDTVPELTPFPMTKFAANRPHHRSHASESVARAEMASFKAQEPKLRRPRARTSSLSAQIAPPVGQYALFPRAYKNTGERI